MKKAIAELDKPRMRELLDQAKELEIDNDDTILEARRLCFAILDSDFRALQFKQAFDTKNLDQLKSLIQVCQDQGTSKQWH
jgi:hypothetical protein